MLEHRRLYEDRFTSLPCTERAPDVERKAIRTFVRSRPLLEGERDSFPCVAVFPLADENDQREGTGRLATEGTKVIIGEPVVGVRGNLAVRWHEEELDGCFVGAATTAQVYDAACKDLVKTAARGGLGTVLFYGQTGSGKTYTAMGMTRLVAEDLFAELQEGWTVKVSCVQVLGDVVTCLLASKEGAPVKVLEDVQCQVHLVGATEMTSLSKEHFVEVLEGAFARRTTRATGRNDVSSRSHFLVRVRISGGPEDGLLHIIDLAGSERARDQSSHDEVRRKEAKLINESLMTLKQCIKNRGEAFSSKSSAHVHIPFRSSKVTQVLKDSLELAVSRPFLLSTVACVSPLPEDSNHSVNTLRFAAGLMCAPPAIVLSDADRSEMPWTWDRERLDEWFRVKSRGKLSSRDFLTGHEALAPGKIMCEMAREDFEEKAAARIGKVGAPRMYELWWGLVVDARTALKEKVGMSKSKKGQEELLVRSEAKNKASLEAGAPKPGAPSASRPAPLSQKQVSGTSSSAVVVSLPSHDPLDPIKWKHDDALSWIESRFPIDMKGKAAQLLPLKAHGGLYLTRLGKTEFLAKCKTLGVLERKAEEMHAELLTLVADAKKRARGK